MRKSVIFLSLSLLLLSVFILTLTIAEEDPGEDILNGTGFASELNRSGWNLTDRGIDFDLYLVNETNSTYYIELASEPINYFNSSAFDPINTTLVSTGCDYDYCVRKGVYFADFYDNYNQNGMIKFYHNGSNIIYTPISLTYYNGSTEQVIANASVNVTGYVNGSSFLYPSIFGSGLDLKYTYMNNLLKKEMAILNNSILPQPNLTGTVYLNINFEFNTSASIYVGEENETGNIIFSPLAEDTIETNISMLKGVNSEGNDSYFILKPIVFDSNESSQRLTYVVNSLSENKIISITIPFAWLNDSSRVYPMAIDPDTSTENARSDYYIWKHVWTNGTIATWGYGSSTSTVPILSTGNFFGLGQNRYKRAIVTYAVSSTARSILRSATSYEGFTVELYDHLEYASSADDDLRIGVIDEHYPRDLAPRTPRDLDDLFNKTDDISAGSSIWTNRWWLVTNPIVNAMNVIFNPAGTEGNAVITNVINNNESFIIGLSGFQTAGVTNEVQYRGVAHSQDKPRLSIRYTCTNRANICDACLDQANGASCDCRGECTGNYCWGTNSTNAVCSSSCATNGQYAAELASCCSGLTWDSGTKQCSTGAPSCPNGKDGSNQYCECDTDNDCPAGQYCHQQAGYDPCLQRQFCNGTIQVKTLTSQNSPISGVKVYLSSNLQGTTNSGGFRDIQVNNVSCGAANNIEVKCSDNTLCGSGNVAIDYNGENDAIQFDCSVCRTDEDLFISQSDVNTNYSESGQTTTVGVFADVHSQNKNVNGLKVRFNLIGTDGLIKDTETNTINIAPNTIVSTNATLSSNPDEVIYVTVQVDPDNQVSEDPKTNNYVRRVVFGRTNGYLDINTGFTEVNSKIREFMETFVEPTSLSNSQIIYSVGRLSTYAPTQQTTSQGCAIRENQVWIDGKQLDNPYTGAICSFRSSGKTVVAAIGSDIDGDIAAVKKLGSAANVYFSGTAVKPRIVLDWNDLTAIGVYDFLHNSENLPYYHVNLPQFGNITEKILNGNTYDVAIRLVNTTNANPTTLRIKNVNSDFSDNYKNTLAANNTRPVVLSGGIFSDLDVWEDDNQQGLANKLARDEGRDTWEIEMTGGPIAENSSALDYTYQNLVDDYWPALIGAVQYYTGKITLDYVGHSNGCRAALSSLKSYQTTGKSNVGWVQNLQTGNYQLVSLQGNSGAHVVNTFVGVACPGELNQVTFLSLVSRTFIINHIPPGLAGNLAMNRINQNHILMRDYTNSLFVVGAFEPGILPDIVVLARLFPRGDKISRNLMDLYNDLSIDPNSNFSLSGLNLNKLRLYYGELPVTDHDGVVPSDDLFVILQGVNSSNENYFISSGSFSDSHVNIKDKNLIKNRIIEELRNG